MKFEPCYVFDLQNAGDKTAMGDFKAAAQTIRAALPASAMHPYFDAWMGAFQRTGILDHQLLYCFSHASANQLKGLDQATAISVRAAVENALSHLRATEGTFSGCNPLERHGVHGFLSLKTEAAA